MTLTDNSIKELAAQLLISPEALEEARHRRLLSFVKHRGLPCWRFGDSRNGCFRRLDGQPFSINGQPVKAESESRGKSWHRLIGVDDAVANNRRDILLTPEGGKDALAALHFAHAEGTLTSTGIVAALGSGVRPTADDIAKLRGHRVRIFPDVDAAGREAGERIGRAIARVAHETQIFDLGNLHRGDGAEVTDLFDLTRMSYSDFESNRELRSIADLDSKGDRLRVITPMNETVPLSLLLPLECPECHVFPVFPVYPVSKSPSLEEELQELATLNACTACNSARKKRFKLNRDLAAIEKRIGRTLGTDERTKALDMWYSRSRPYLDPRKTRADYLAKFFSERAKVLVPTGEGDALRNALQIVLSLAVRELPELPGIPSAQESWRRLAALHRELSRQSADGVYFLGCRDAARAHASLNKDKANDINHALASVDVIKIVKLGEAKPGGGASEFRYLLPL